LNASSATNTHTVVSTVLTTTNAASTEDEIKETSHERGRCH
jgi:hypothetical protein